MIPIGMNISNFFLKKNKIYSKMDQSKFHLNKKFFFIYNFPKKNGIQLDKFFFILNLNLLVQNKNFVVWF